MCKSTKRPTVSEIIEHYLKDNSYDGLWVKDCACSLNDGIFPCQCECLFFCFPGVFRKPYDPNNYTIEKKEGVELIKVSEIIGTYLRNKGFDGLIDCEGCSCTLGDLATCEDVSMLHCIPGYLAKGR